MTSVSKNIKTLRAAANISQDTLAEQLHVSRQTISSWETGRTQPDLDCLSSLSEALGVDITELIYGKKPAQNGAYEKKQKKYGVLALILGIFILTVLALSLFWYPNARRVFSATYTYPPLYIEFGFLLRPLAYAGVGVFAAALTSLWMDIRLHGRWRQVVLWVSVAAFIFFFAPWLTYYLSFTFQFNFAVPTIIYPLWRWFASSGSLPALLPALPALGIFLGVNK